jgi:hypothetical protein
MSAERRALSADGIGFGIALGAAGIYFVMVGFGLLPMPGGEDAAHGPPAVIVAAGAAFLFAGIALAIRAQAGADDRSGDLPADAPPWTQMAYRVTGIAIAGSLAAIGTWIAIDSGPRAFDMSWPMMDMQPAGEVIGRTVFGLGAVIVWIYVIALTVGTVRKIFDRHG